MIKSIILNGYKIFKNTSFNNCSNYNLIFGYNGSVKSTLAKLLKDIEYGNAQFISKENNKDYEIKTDSDNSKLNIKVFYGTNYINDNITKTDDNFIFFDIGKDTIALKQEKDIILGGTKWK